MVSILLNQPHRIRIIQQDQIIETCRPVWCSTGISAWSALFVLSTSDLEKIAEKHNLDAHFYADDSQLYIFSKPQFADSAQTRLIACLDDFAQWMSANRLKLNPDKTEFMRCATARRLPQLAKEVVTFGNSSILPATTVRNLGVVVDQKLSFQSHVNKTVSSCFYQLRRLKSSVKALPFGTAKMLVNSFVISRIDYCNSILAGAPQYLLNRLQRVHERSCQDVMSMQQRRSR